MKFEVYWLFTWIVFSVQASIAANTWVVSGAPQTKSKQLYLFSLLLYAFIIKLSFVLYAVVYSIYDRMDIKIDM